MISIKIRILYSKLSKMVALIFNSSNAEGMQMTIGIEFLSRVRNRPP